MTRESRTRFCPAIRCRGSLAVLTLALSAAPLMAQASGKWPPDSLVNVKVIPRSTPVNQVIGAMRNITGGLGVRCHFCHVGEEGMPLEKMDFPSDKKREKLAARQMMRMVEEINRRLDTLPERDSTGLRVTCGTCHRGLSRPMPLTQVMVETATAGGADSATRVYRVLRERYFGRDAYDFGEQSLNTAAFRLAQGKRFDDAMALLALNEGFFSGSSRLSVFRGNIHLLRADTAAAVAAYREAMRRDSTNGEARGRLRDLGPRP